MKTGLAMSGIYGRHGNLPVVSSVHYTSGPPAKLNTSTDDGDVIETKKQEEWITSKKVEVKKNRQIETRVKRQVVLEDGRVVEDSGPLVSTNTTEDVTTSEKENTEHRKLGDDSPPGDGWVAIPGAVIVSEKKERTTNTKEERHDEFETEQVDQLGDINHRDLVRAIKEKGDLRLALAKKQRTWSEPSDVSDGSRPRVVHQSSKHKKVVDSEEVDEHSEIKDGKITTETKKTLYREEFNNEQEPDDEEFSDQEATKETSHNFVHTKDENLVEYVAVPEGGTLAQGKKIGEGMHYVSENIEEEREGGEGQEADQGILVPGHWRSPNKPAAARSSLLARSMNLDQEEETRKLETSKWLENHFGSEDSARSSEEDRSRRSSRLDAGTGRKGSGMITVKMTGSPVASATPSPTPGVKPEVRRSSISQSHQRTPPAPPPPPPKPSKSSTLYQGLKSGSDASRVYKTEESGDLYALPDRRAKTPKATFVPDPETGWRRASNPIATSFRHEYDQIARQMREEAERDPVPSYKRPEEPYKPVERSQSMGPKSVEHLYAEGIRKPAVAVVKKTTASIGTSPPRRGPVADVSYATAPPPMKPERKKKKAKMQAISRSAAEAASAPAAAASATPSAKTGAYTLHGASTHRYTHDVPSQAPVERPARQSSPGKRHNTTTTNVFHSTLKETRSDPDQMRWRFSSDNGTQTMPKSLGSKTRQGQPDGASKPRLQQYYLGEDPYKAPLFSQQAQDRQYENVRNVRREVRQMKKSASTSVKPETISSTLDRNWKSSKIEPEPQRSATLPRKPSNVAGSMFNISIVNNVEDNNRRQQDRLLSSSNTSSPTSRVNRSQSFNVTGLGRPSGLRYTSSTRVDIGGTYSPLAHNKSSSSSLQRLHDNTEPLKSPDVLKIVRTASLRRGLDSVDTLDSNERYFSTSSSTPMKTPLYNTFSNPITNGDSIITSQTPKRFTNGIHHTNQNHHHSSSSEDDPKRQKFLQGLLTSAPELFKHLHGEQDDRSTSSREKITTTTATTTSTTMAATTRDHQSTSSGSSGQRDKLLTSISVLGSNAKPSEVRRNLSDRIKSPTPPKSNETFAKMAPSRVSETLEISRSPEGYKTVTKSVVQRTLVPAEDRFERAKYGDAIKYIDVKSSSPAAKQQRPGVFIEVRDWNSR